MRTIKNRIRLISVVLTCLMLFQSCRVYQRKQVSLDKAVAEKKRVKIKTRDGKKLKFKKIVLDGNAYYGLKKVKGKEVRIPLKTNSLKSIRLHNKTLSIIYSTGIGFVAATIIYAVAFWDGPNVDIAPIQFPN